MIKTLNLDSGYVANHAARYLARDSADTRHSFFGHLENSPRARFSDGWRFPIVDGFREANEPSASLDWNRVTFVFRAEDPGQPPLSVAVVGSFSPGFKPVAMQRVEQTRYWAVTLLLPTCRVFRYQFLVDGQFVTDGVNTKLVLDDALREWSFFWTHYCQQLVTFETWEATLLRRLTNHILPFNSRAARDFLQKLDASKLGGSAGRLYRLDLAVGVVNFIDKLVAGPELHQRFAYKTCLAQINKVLRRRNPYFEPRDMDEQFYIDLYDALAKNNVPEWDTSVYNDPSYFLKLLRRHTVMGAFSHPKYGGNVGAAAWDYLAERFTNPQGESAFKWGQAIEQPWGTSTEYAG